MTLLEKHEIFEMEVLERLQSTRVLESLIFGGGTMLRLCHEMKRFSADLDFWKHKDILDETLFTQIQETLAKYYEFTDAQIKHFTLLFEIRSSHFPRRLKIEVRHERREWDFETKIAYSKLSTRQVIVKGHTLRQSLENKIAALIDRGEIRDAFDIEFILRRGIPLPKLTEFQKKELLSRLDRFKPIDFKVTLGSVLEKDIRTFYIENGFRFLRQKLAESTSG
jgi:predicted nucleotidyltransferase component of viral defense system